MIMQLDTHPECQPDECFTGNTNAGALRVGDTAYRRDGSILPGYHPIFAKEQTVPCNLSHSVAIKIADSLPTSCQFELAARLKIIEALARPGAGRCYTVESVEAYTEFIRQISRVDYKFMVNYASAIFIFWHGENMARVSGKYVKLSQDCTEVFRSIVKQTCRPAFEDITINLTVAQKKAVYRLLNQR